jgi:hypothetical protein
MAKYLFERIDNGQKVSFEMSQAEFSDECVKGLMVKASRLDPRKKIRYRFVRVEKLRLPDGVNVFPCPSTYPMKSDAMGINPDEIEHARAAAIAMGVPTDFDPESGEAIFTGPAHRKKYCEAMGVLDWEGGYSDPQSMSDEERARKYPQAMAFLEN